MRICSSKQQRVDDNLDVVNSNRLGERKVERFQYTSECVQASRSDSLSRPVNANYQRQSMAVWQFGGETRDNGRMVSTTGWHSYMLTD